MDTVKSIPIENNYLLKKLIKCLEDSEKSPVPPRTIESLQNDAKITLYKLKNPFTNKNTNENGEKNDCPICFNEIPKLNIVLFNCVHIFCTDCTIKQFSECNKNKKIICCAICRRKVTKIIVHGEDYDKIRRKFSSRIIV
jgi:hypothetical protein